MSLKIDVFEEWPILLICHSVNKKRKARQVADARSYGDEISERCRKRMLERK